MGGPIFVPEVQLVWILDHAELVVPIVLAKGFPFQGAYFEICPKQSWYGSPAGVFGIDKGRTAPQFIRDIFLRSRLHDHVLDDLTGAEATKGLLPHQFLDSRDVLEKGRLWVLEVRADFTILSGGPFTWEACNDQDPMCVSLYCVLYEFLRPRRIHVGYIFEEDFTDPVFHREAVCERALLSCVGEDDRKTSDCFRCDMCSSQPCEELDDGYSNSPLGFIGHMPRSRHTWSVEGLSPRQLIHW